MNNNKYQKETSQVQGFFSIQESPSLMMGQMKGPLLQEMK